MLGKSIFKDTSLMILVFLGAMAVIALFSLSIWYFKPSYQLGDKEVLLSDLREYFSREPEVGVTIGNENPYPPGGNSSSRYELIANYDFQIHGNLTTSTWNGKVMDVTLLWKHGGNKDLIRSGELMMSGIVDNTIPDWQENDGQLNRNVELFNWIDANLPMGSEERDGHIDWDFSERRVLNVGKSPDEIFLNVFIEP